MHNHGAVPVHSADVVPGPTIFGPYPTRYQIGMKQSPHQSCSPITVHAGPATLLWTHGVLDACTAPTGWDGQHRSTRVGRPTTPPAPAPRPALGPPVPSPGLCTITVRHHSQHVRNVGNCIHKSPALLPPPPPHAHANTPKHCSRSGSRFWVAPDPEDGPVGVDPAQHDLVVVGPDCERRTMACAARSTGYGTAR